MPPPDADDPLRTTGHEPGPAPTSPGVTADRTPGSSPDTGGTGPYVPGQTAEPHDPNRTTDDAHRTAAGSGRSAPAGSLDAGLAAGFAAPRCGGPSPAGGGRGAHVPGQ